MQLKLTGKRAIVCGSTQGIGKSTAEILAQMGAAVTLIARDEKRLKEIKGNLSTVEGNHDYLVADFSQPAQLESALQNYALIHEAVILINNTGGPPAGTALSAQVEDFNAAFQAHLVCNHLLTQAVVPAMKTASYGRIINIISTSVKAPIPGLGVSNTIRGAVANWAKTLATELGPFGITVNNVLPGMTQTARLDAIIANNAKKQGISIAEAAEKMKAATPAKRFANAEEVASAAAFLASPVAGYINGINLPVDGGRTPSL